MRTGKLYIALGVAVSLTGAGLVAAQQRADTPTNPFANDPAAPAAGKKIFDSTCIVCHGEGAAGTDRAPSLRGGLKVGDDPYDIFTTIHDGVRGTAMPPFAAMPANDIWRLVSYVKSLSGGAATPAAAPSRPGAAPAPAQGATQVASGDAVAGERLFFGTGGCASCHEVSGRGSPLAADLSEVGAKPLAQVRSGVLHANLPPPRFGAAPFRLAEVTSKAGGKDSGVIRSQDSFTVRLQRRDGSWALLDRDKVATITPLADGGPPADVAARLGPKGVEDVVAYLAGQKKRDAGQLAKVNPTPVLPYARIAARTAEPHNWPTYWGDYQGHHFSELTQITTANVGGLQAKWAASLPGASLLQSTPLVIDGVMYVSGPPGDVYALDARTGGQLWKYSRKQDVVNPYQINPSNRGVAVLDGRVFFNTLDNNLIALDARTGRPLWEKRLGDTMTGMTITSAPLALKDKIVTGMSGGEGGVNGWLEAFDPATGEKLWHFDVIPGPGQPGHETWAGDSWKTGAGATWLTGSYDVESNTVIWATGNPGPDFNHVVREGDNLWANSVVALDADSGKMKWGYQFTPNDSHDWDSVQDMVLADRVVDGKLRKVLLHADRNGFYYMLDRTNGQFIRAAPFVHQTWNDGFDAKGRPKVRPDSEATLEGVRVYPAIGGTNFQAPSFDKQAGVFYMAFQDAEGFANYAPQTFEPGKLFYARGSAPRPQPLREPIQGIKALNADTGQTLWTFPLTRNSLSAGVLGTRGGTVFAATAEGWFLGLDAKTGKPLWRFNTGGSINASPMSYAVDGKQYVAVSAGNTVYAFALPN